MQPKNTFFAKRKFRRVIRRKKFRSHTDYRLVMSYASADRACVRKCDGVITCRKKRGAYPFMNEDARRVRVV